MKSLHLFLLALLLVPATSFASGEDIDLGGRHVVYWAPAPSLGKQPLILFSHGFKGCATQSIFLTEALAADGYWVFAPNHKDAACHRADGTRTITFGQADLGFFQPENWDENTYSDRRDDMNAVLDALQKDSRFKDKIDFTRIGLVGHSLGGYTVLGLSGAWPSWKMPNVKAVLALSPYSQPFNLKHTIGNVSVPVMYQGGTRDFGITPFVAKTEGSYDLAHKPKYFVDLDGAGHFAWTNLVKTHQNVIIDYSEAFLDHYLKGDAASRDLTSATGGVAQLRYDSELGSNDRAP